MLICGIFFTVRKQTHSSIVRKQLFWEEEPLEILTIRKNTSRYVSFIQNYIELKQPRWQTAVKMLVKKWICINSSFTVFIVLLDLSNLGEFSSSWILKDSIQVQKEKGKFFVVFLLPQNDKKIRKFHVVDVQWMSKKYTRCCLHPSGCISSLLFQAVWLSEQKEWLASCCVFYSRPGS